MNPPSPSTELALREENAGLRERLEQAEEMLEAIRHGEVDALVVESAAGPQVYTLQGLDAEQNRFRGEMLAQVNEVVVAIDDNHRVIYANAAAERRYGVSSCQMLGRPLTDIYQSDWPRPGAEEEMMRTLAETGHWTGELVHILLNGERIDVETSVTGIPGGDGTSCVLLGVSRDITERKQAEEALRAHHEDLARFNRAAVDRELRMIELKKEINALCAQSGQAPRHRVECTGTSVQTPRPR